MWEVLSWATGEECETILAEIGMRKLLVEETGKVGIKNEAGWDRHRLYELRGGDLVTTERLIW